MFTPVQLFAGKVGDSCDAKSRLRGRIDEEERALVVHSFVP